MGLMLTAILVFSSVAVGFASGFGARELISRRRRATEREAYYERHPEKRHALLKSVIASSRVDE